MQQDTRFVLELGGPRDVAKLALGNGVADLDRWCHDCRERDSDCSLANRLSDRGGRIGQDAIEHVRMYRPESDIKFNRVQAELNHTHLFTNPFGEDA